MTPQKTFVTGTSILSSAGLGSQEVWNSILNGKRAQGYRDYTLSDGQCIRYPVYSMPHLALDDWLSSPMLDQLAEVGLQADPDFIALVVAARLALIDADLVLDDSKTRVALIVGHENLGVNQLINQILTTDRLTQLESIQKNALSSYHEFSKEFFTLQTFSHLFYLAKCLEINGQTFTVNNACATGLYALELGSMLIESNQADVALVVCSDYAHATEHLWLEDKGFCSKSGSLRPFARDRDGSILGDGAAAVILESQSHLEYRVKKAVCSYRGGSFKQGLWNMTIPDVTKHLYAVVMSEAQLKRSKPQVDLLVPHGAGIPLWDMYEAREIEHVFQASSCPDLTAFKAYIGHTLGANSLIEAILAIYCMKSNLIPPISTEFDLDPKINLPFGAQIQEKRIDSVMKAVCAYGGFNAACIFEELDEV